MLLYPMFEGEDGGLGGFGISNDGPAARMTKTGTSPASPYPLISMTSRSTPSRVAFVKAPTTERTTLSTELISSARVAGVSGRSHFFLAVSYIGVSFKKLSKSRSPTSLR